MPVSKNTATIPDHVLLEARQRLRSDIGPFSEEKLNTYDRERLKSFCGPDYAHWSTDDIVAQAGNVRKRSSVRESKKKRERNRECSPEYQAYLKSEHWLQFAERVRRFWEYRCALCNKERARDVHHRTYERLRQERLSDCILLCRDCHNKVEKWLHLPGNDLFNDIPHI